MGNLMGNLLKNSFEKEDRLWEKLPYELQIEIVKRLSAQSLCRLRLASIKYFHSLFSKQSFVIDYDRLHHAHPPNLIVCDSPSDEPYLYLEEKLHDAMSTSRSRWQERLCHVPKSVVARLWASGVGMFRPKSEVEAFLWASGDGFFCFVTPRTSPLECLVVNPLFPSDRYILTLPICGDLTIRGIAFDRKDGIFKFVLHRLSTKFIYNFKEETWKKIERGGEVDSISNGSRRGIGVRRGRGVMGGDNPYGEEAISSCVYCRA